MRGALMTGTTGRQGVSGLTLVEVLSTVFIMGLGLIMVAAAFPVGIDQVRRSVEDAQSAMAARSALELLHGENIFQNMTEEDWNDLAVGSKVKVWPHGENAKSNYFRVHNPWRRLYHASSDSDMWPEVSGHPEKSGPKPGDLVWRAFLMRLTETDEMPLFRVTIVVVKYSRQSPELYMPEDPELVSSRTLLIDYHNISNNLISASSAAIGGMVEGDYLMDPDSGFCYRISGFDKNFLTRMYLATKAEKQIEDNTECYVFSNVVGIYYTMISG